MNNFSSLIENSKQAVRYWGLLLIIGIALFAVGVLIFVYPAQSYLGMSLVFGWLMLISGILEVVLSSANKHFITGRGWMMAGGIIEIILGIILIWISINVTNCSDGVDGLCASLSCVVIFAFSMIFHDVLGSFTVANYLFVAALLAYLYFNTSPSSMLMGDAGSRALGFYIAILAMQSRHPFLYLLMAGVMIVDGGIGLVKVFLLRFLKIAILKNTRTPLHDHVRLKYKWSDSQVVIRFVILQILLAVVAYLIVA